ncbi:MAG: copper chaperone PCu(A)C, partial [Pseudomonadota bacterium]
ACGGTAPTAIEVEANFVRAPSVGAPATAGYLTLTAAEADALISATTDMAETMELHTMTMNNGVMSMRPVSEIELPAGTPVELKPGGLHLMLMNPKDELASLDEVDITLNFENAAPVVVTLPVRQP